MFQYELILQNLPALNVCVIYINCFTYINYVSFQLMMYINHCLNQYVLYIKWNSCTCNSFQQTMFLINICFKIKITHMIKGTVIFYWNNYKNIKKTKNENFIILKKLQHNSVFERNKVSSVKISKKNSLLSLVIVDSWFFHMWYDASFREHTSCTVGNQIRIDY